MVNRGEVAFNIAASKHMRSSRRPAASPTGNSGGIGGGSCHAFISVKLLIVFLALIIFLSAGRMFLEQLAARSKKRGASIVAAAGGAVDPGAPGGIVLPAGNGGGGAGVGAGGGADDDGNAREEMLQILSLSKPYMSKHFLKTLNETFFATTKSDQEPARHNNPDQSDDDGTPSWNRLREQIFTRRAQTVLERLQQRRLNVNAKKMGIKEKAEGGPLTLVLPIRREFVTFRHIHKLSALCTTETTVAVHVVYALQNRSSFFSEDLEHLLPATVVKSVANHRYQVSAERAILDARGDGNGGGGGGGKKRKKHARGIRMARVRHADGSLMRYMSDVLLLLPLDSNNETTSTAAAAVSIPRDQWISLFAPCVQSVAFLLIEPLDALPSAPPKPPQTDPPATKKKQKKQMNKKVDDEGGVASTATSDDGDLDEADVKPPIPFADLVMVALQCDPMRDTHFVAVLSEAHIPFEVPGDNNGGDDLDDSTNSQHKRRKKLLKNRSSFIDELIKPMRFGSGNISVTQCTIAQRDKSKRVINETLRRLRLMKHRGFGNNSLAQYELSRLEQQRRRRSGGDVGRAMQLSNFSSTKLAASTGPGGHSRHHTHEVVDDESDDADVHDFVLVDRGLEVGMGNDKQFMIPHIVRRFHDYPLVDGRRHLAEPVEMVSPYCFAADRFRFALAGGLVSDSSSTFADDVISGRLSRHLRASAIALVRIRITKVEKVMEGISLVDVHKAGNSLRQQVRLAYSEVVESTTLWEDVSGTSFDRADSALTRSDMYIEVKRREEAEWASLEGSLSKVEERLAAHAARLHDASRDLLKLGKNRDSSATEEEIGWDFSLRLQRMYRYWYLAVSTATALYDMFAIPQPLLEYFDANKISLNHASYVADGAFFDRWSAALTAVHRSKGGVHSALQHVVSVREQAAVEPNTRIFWHSFCCGCCGFSSEIVHFVHPLSSRRSVHLFNSNRCFCQGYPGAVTDALKRMHISQEHYVVQHQNPGDLIIWISHTDPLSYHITLLEKRKPDYFVGRSMYEFSRISKAWVESIEKYADEVWVPAKFVRSVFIRSGVKPEKLVVVPEPLDVYYFDPAAHDPLPLPLNESRPEWWQWCNKPVPDADKRYKFFSNFKWEPRKGWDVLFEAYDRAFGASSTAQANPDQQPNNVSLYVLSYFFFNGPSPEGSNIHNVSLMLNQLKAWAADRLPHIANLSDLPHFCIITEMVSEEDLVRLYRTMDAFVLPTRGEGWGLPTIQAMSMGMPTISTNWGGNTEFMTKDTSFLIPVDGLDELPKGNLYGSEGGKKWALPSVAETSSLMRHVWLHATHATEVGLRARRHIVERFSEAAILDIVDQRLEDIRKIIRAK